MKALILVSTLFVSASAISAPVYKCEKNGTVTYTSVACPAGTGSKIDLPELSITSTVKSSSPGVSTASGPSLPGVVQTNPSDAQKKRESKRNDILQEELNKEVEALSKAEKTLAEQKEVRSGDEKNYSKVIDRLKPYEEEIALRKKNIEALKKEMDTSR